MAGKIFDLEISGDKISSLGWAPKIELKDGIAMAYREFLAGHVHGRVH